MAIELRDHLLVRATGSDDGLGKTMTLVCEGSSRTLPQLLPVLIWWKRGFHLKPCQEIGDGMSVVTLYEREPLDFPWFANACARGLLSYSEYDEQQDKHCYFLYKSQHSEQELQRIDTRLSSAFPGSRLQKNRFVQIVIQPQEEIVTHQLVTDSIQQVVSWLFGLALAYGSRQIRDEQLVRVLISVPQVGSLMTVGIFLDEIKPILHEYGLLLGCQIVRSTNNDVLQIIIQDAELLALFVSWYTDEPISHKSPYIEPLEQFLAQRGVDGISAQILSHSVLKMRQK